MTYVGRVPLDVFKQGCFQTVIYNKSKIDCCWASEWFGLLSCFIHFIMRSLSGVFQVRFHTRTSGVVISSGFLIPADVLGFTAAKSWPPLFVRWACVQAASTGCVAAHRGMGDARSILQLPLRWGVCVGTPLLALQPLVALWHICDVMIRKSQVFVSKMAWSSPITHQFDTVHLSPFLHDSGLLISPSVCAGGWQRDCIATGVYVPTEFCRATPGRWLTALLKD